MGDVEAAAFGGSFLGQNFDMCPSCLQLQQRGHCPSTTTIICLSLLMITSGMHWNPSLVKHSRNTWSPSAVPAADLRSLFSSTLPNLLRKAASTSPVINAGTLQTVTQTYGSPCIPAAELGHRTPAFLRRSSNPSFFSPNEPSCLEVRDYQRYGSRIQLFDDLRDGQDFVVLKVLGIPAHPVFFLIFWTFCGTFQDAGLGSFSPCPG